MQAANAIIHFRSASFQLWLVLIENSGPKGQKAHFSRYNLVKNLPLNQHLGELVKRGTALNFDWLVFTTLQETSFRNLKSFHFFIRRSSSANWSPDWRSEAEIQSGEHTTACETFVFGKLFLLQTLFITQNFYNEWDPNWN